MVDLFAKILVFIRSAINNLQYLGNLLLNYAGMKLLPAVWSFLIDANMHFICKEFLWLCVACFNFLGKATKLC